MLKFNQFIAEKKMAAPKIDANRGDLAEIILGAAVAAKFKYPPLSGTPTISKAEVKEILAMVITAASKKTILQRADKQKGTVKVDDNIEFKVGVPAKAWTFVSDKNNWRLVDDLFTSSVGYVNNDRRLRGQVNKVYINGKKDFVLVNSDGTGDQKGTKADIKLSINGKQTVNQISLKVEGGEQFAQVAGVTFDKQLEIWGRLGVNVSSAKTAFENELKDVDLTLRFADRGNVNLTKMGTALRSAASKSYSEAAKQLKTKVDIDKLTDFLIYGATKGEANIELVKLVGAGKSSPLGFKRAKFGKQFKENLRTVFPNLQVAFEFKSDPIVHIYDPSRGNMQSSKARLIRIRGFFQRPSSKSKISGKTYGVYLRNIVEAGDILFELATDR